jgi:Spy/CpxP family protein refolding chaperone
MAGGILLAAAQEVPNQAPPPAAMQQQPHRNARLARYLNLTPAQQAQAKAEFQQARQAAEPLRQQLIQVRQNMFQAERANDTARINQLSAREAHLKGRISAMRHEAFARLYVNLSPEQRAKADQLPAHLQQMKQRRMENRQAPNNG